MTNAARFDFDSHPPWLRLGNVSFHKLKRPASLRDLDRTHFLAHEFQSPRSLKTQEA